MFSQNNMTEMRPPSYEKVLLQRVSVKYYNINKEMTITCDTSQCEMSDNVIETTLISLTISNVLV